MLSKKNRLTKKKDFENIFRKGLTFKKDFLMLRTSPNPLQTSRFAFVVSQKVSKKAVVRNKIKRQLRELIRPRMDKIKKGVDGVFIALPGLDIKNPEKTKNTLEDLFKKAKIIKK